MAPSDDKPFDVFISHSTQDTHPASAIKQQLQAAGLKCWKAPDDINPGESWPSAITRALSTCRIMVLVWSSHSLASKEVSKELTLAMRNGLTVIPFRIENVRPTGEWDYHLANTHWMDAFPGDLQPFVEQLALRIRGLLGRASIAGSSESQGIEGSTGTRGAAASPATHRGSRSPAAIIGATALAAVAAMAVWFLARSPGKSPADTAAIPATTKTSDDDVVNLREELERARQEKAEALRVAAEREAESLRQTAQRAEAEKQLALDRASKAEQSAREAQAGMPSAPLPSPAAAGIDESKTPSGGQARQGIISDPDGYTNIRLGRGTKNRDGSEMPIVGRIVEGEIFEYFPDDSNWWMVRTSDGIQGFVHNSRIKEAR